MGAYIISDKSVYPVAEGAVIASRDMVWINDDGFAEAAPVPLEPELDEEENPIPPPQPDRCVVGSAAAAVDNSNGSDGDVSIVVEHSLGRRPFLLTGDGVTAADVGQPCYVAGSAKTVSTESEGAVLAGRIIEVDGDRVKVVLQL